MKTPERFNNAITKLVKAFFNGTLAKSDCSMCAVGNICDGNPHWNKLFCTYMNCSEKQTLHYLEEDIDIYRLEKGLKAIKSTGYSIEELARVENAFERKTKIVSEKYNEHTKEEIMEDQYKGLMAVVDVLCSIEGIDTTPIKKAFEYDITSLTAVNELETIDL